MGGRAVGEAEVSGEDGLVFADREAFRQWLASQELPRPGVWLVLGKRGGPVTVSAAQALEEALCHGWIDGQLRRVDETRYLKYFAPRRRGSVWSVRNRALVDQLETRGVMTPAGRAVVAAAKADGSWDSPVVERPGETEVADLETLVSARQPALTHWQQMPPSVRRTYTAFYLDAKTEPTRARRLERILDRLDQNLRPM